MRRFIRDRFGMLRHFKFILYIYTEVFAKYKGHKNCRIQEVKFSIQDKFLTAKFGTLVVYSKMKLEIFSASTSASGRCVIDLRFTIYKVKQLSVHSKTYTNLTIY